MGWVFGHLERQSYRVILADPNWAFRPYTREISRKAAAHHYAVMSLADLKRLPVADLAARDSALLMWCTQAQLDQGFELLDAWGFKFKTAGAWAKQSKTGKRWAFGTGYIFRSAAEFYLLGTRGNPKTQHRGIRNLIVSPVREHSRKPDEMHGHLEKMFPQARKCELFARAERPGWDCWGKELRRFSTVKRR